jgi:heptose III glucuronosyltransferase
MSLSIVIPIHNEARVLETAVRDILHGVCQIERSVEIVLVENGSLDGTAEVASRLAKQFAEVRVVEGDVLDFL